MQRGSDKNSARQDDRLEAELAGKLGSAGGHREEWADPQPPADDDPPRADTTEHGQSDRDEQRHQENQDRMDRQRDIAAAED
jgi:hypothetical protein